MSTRKADPRASRPASSKRASDDRPTGGDEASGIDGLFVDDLPRPAPRPRRKGSKEVSDKSVRTKDRDRERSKSSKSDANGEQARDKGEKRKNGRASERRRERGEAPGVVDGPPTAAALKRDPPRSSQPSSGFHTTGASGKLAYAVGALLCEKGPEEGLSLKLLEGDYTIGRARENSFVLKDIAASREHLRVRVQGNTCLAIDQGSGNGTKVNGARITEHVLKDGDQIEIGNSVLVYKHMAGDESRSGQSVRVGTNPGVQRAATQERIVMAAERLAAELSERFRREEDDGLDEDPATNLERGGKAKLKEMRLEQERQAAQARPQLSVVDNSEIAHEIREMVEQVSRPDLARAIPDDMWGDSETETRYPGEQAAQSPSQMELARAPTRPPMPKANVPMPQMTPVARSQTPPPIPTEAIPAARSHSGDGFPPVGHRLPTRVPASDGSSYVHKTRAVAQQEKSRSVVLVTALLVALIVGISLGVAWVLFGDNTSLLARSGGESSEPANGEATTTNAPGDTKPVDAKPSDAKPVDAKPNDAKPNDAKPGDAKPNDAKPVDAKPNDAKPVDAKPNDAKPVDDGAQAEKAKAEQAKADAAKAEQAKADAAKAEQAKAEQAKAEAAKAEQAKAEAAKREAENRKKAERREPKREPKREPVKAKEEPKPEPPKKPKGMDDAQAKALVAQAVGGLKNDDYDEACPLLARVARDAPEDSTWRLKAQNLQRARCQ